MAIDVLARPGAVPMIVGDPDDMAGAIGVATDAAGAPVLLLRDREDRLQRVTLDARTAHAFKGQDEAVLVAVDEEGEIAGAWSAPIGAAEGACRKLDAAEIRTLAEALVGGDFHIDFAR